MTESPQRILKLSGQNCLKANFRSKKHTRASELLNKSQALNLSNELTESLTLAKILPLMQNTSTSPIKITKTRIVLLKNPPELKLQVPESNNTVPTFENVFLGRLIENRQQQRTLHSFATFDRQHKKNLITEGQIGKGSINFSKHIPLKALKKHSPAMRTKVSYYKFEFGSPYSQGR
ncbi:hypothetical protein SteCoe_21430 [Stentor coeruleus]|uniref:Uncharacterized protein n=1 Tax=Stentor coeruleus TaxID=5963 RepID=A0A1R2BPS8_9CILI|nr:hypothetical protein SteCoe_21430 [Stentor coeruleus]